MIHLRYYIITWCLTYIHITPPPATVIYDEVGRMTIQDELYIGEASLRTYCEYSRLYLDRDSAFAFVLRHAMDADVSHIRMDSCDIYTSSACLSLLDTFRLD